MRRERHLQKRRKPTCNGDCECSRTLGKLQHSIHRIVYSICSRLSAICHDYFLQAIFLIFIFWLSIAACCTVSWDCCCRCNFHARLSVFHTRDTVLSHMLFFLSTNSYLLPSRQNINPKYLGITGLVGGVQGC